MRHLIAITTCVLFLSCSEGDNSAPSVCFKDYDISLGDNLDTVLKQIDLMVDWNGENNGITETRKDYFSVSEPSIPLANGQLNPSVFAVFDQNDKLISFSVSYLCDLLPDERPNDETLKILKTEAFKCVDGLNEHAVFDDYYSDFVLDTTGVYWSYRYDIGYLKEK